MDYELIKVAIMVANIIFTLIIGIMAGRNKKEAELDRKDKATISSINRIEENLGRRINEVENKVSLVEQYASQAPTHNDLGKIYDRLNVAIADVKELTGEFKHISANLNRLYQYELDKHRHD
jgi:hypothetical protein